MNPSQSPNPLSNLLLDRLVDDELSETEYRETLALIQSTPDGWQRCAQAFLEAQALSRELQGWPAPATNELSTSSQQHDSQTTTSDENGPQDPIRPHEKVQPVRQTVSHSRIQRLWHHPLTTPLATSAALVLAFWIGWSSHSGSREDSFANRPSRLAADDFDQTNPRDNQDGNQIPSGQMRLVVDRPNDTQQEVAVPYFSPEHYATQSQSSPPPSVLDSVARQGQVQRYRAVYPEQLNERESVLVPIEYYAVSPKGDFQ